MDHTAYIDAAAATLGLKITGEKKSRFCKKCEASID